VRDPARMQTSAIQDLYPDDFAHCYGCGRLNAHGLHVRSTWDGDETVARLTPRPEHIAVPGFVYGGLVASLIDCHGIGTAALHVDYSRPTPLGTELEARSWVAEIGERKVVVEVDVLAHGDVCARGRVVAVRMPESMRTPGSAS